MKRAELTLRIMRTALESAYRREVKDPMGEYMRLCHKAQRLTDTEVAIKAMLEGIEQAMDDESIALDIWTVKDIQSVGESFGYQLDIQQAQLVLRRVEDELGVDGINADSILAVIEFNYGV